MAANPETQRTQASWLPWLVCFSASLFFFYEFIQMNMLNSLGSYLVTEYKINATQLGNLSAWYFYANLIFLLTAGSLLDRISTRKIILTAMIVCVLGTLLFGLSKSIAISSICRFVTGIGSAFCFLSCVRLASRWFPSQRMALVTGLIVTMAMLGGMVAQTPLTLLAEHIGWRPALYVDAALGATITLIVWLFVKDFPSTHQQTHEKEQEDLQKLGFLQAQRLAFLNKQNWLAGLYTCFLNLPVSLLGALWGNTYLQKVNQLSATDASYITSMIFFGTVVGSPLAGWISDKMGRRRLPMIIGAVLAIIIVLMIIYLPNLPWGVLMVLFLALGLVSSTQVISYPTVAESNSKLLTATSVSVVSISAIGGYAVFQPLFGRIMDWHWMGQLVDGVRVYTEADYRFAITIMPIAFAIGLIGVLFLRETYCKPID